MTKTLWTVKGKVGVEHQLPELSNHFNGESMLEGIKVKVSARTRVAGGWGWWNSWGTTRTNAQGAYSIAKEKNRNDRQFKVEVKFQDNDLEVRHSTSTSALTKVKWYTIIKEDTVDHRPGTIDFGLRKFKAGGQHDRGDGEAREHADTWVLYKMAIEYMAQMGNDFAFDNIVKVKLRHNGITPDTKEASYANPITKVIYIVKNSLYDDFDTGTMLHELGHRYIYGHMSGEGCLTEGLLQDGSTHGLVDDHCVAFGEGIAQYWSEKMFEELFGYPAHLPFNRAHLNNGVEESDGTHTPLTSMNLMQRHDQGWCSFLHTLTTPDLHLYNFSESGDVIHSNFIIRESNSRIGCIPPNIGFKNVLKIFQAHNGLYELSSADTTFAAFLDRAVTILTRKMTPEFRDLFLVLADPSSTEQPSDRLCLQPVRRPPDIKHRPVVPSGH